MLSIKYVVHSSTRISYKTFIPVTHDYALNELRNIGGGGFGRAITQAVSRWLPTAAVRVQTRV
jgi:hypothetical protein